MQAFEDPLAALFRQQEVVKIDYTISVRFEQLFAESLRGVVTDEIRERLALVIRHETPEIVDDAVDGLFNATFNMLVFDRLFDKNWIRAGRRVYEAQQRLNR